MDEQTHNDRMVEERLGLTHSLFPIFKRMQERISKELEEWKLPFHAVDTLVLLDVHPDLWEPAQLAERVRIPRQTMTSVLDTLERRGLVRRGPHPSDRRRVRLEVTPEGHKITLSVIDRVRAMEEHARAALGSDADKLLELIRRFEEALG